MRATLALNGLSLIFKVKVTFLVHYSITHIWFQQKLTVKEKVLISIFILLFDYIFLILILDKVALDICSYKYTDINLFHSSVLFHKETNHLICTANQVAGFYMKCNTA